MSGWGLDTNAWVSTDPVIRAKAEAANQGKVVQPIIIIDGSGLNAGKSQKQLLDEQVLREKAVLEQTKKTVKTDNTKVLVGGIVALALGFIAWKALKK